VFTNQIRMKIGVMFGSPETTSGGNALKFYSTIRMDIRRIGSLKEGETVLGNRTKVKVVKNKVAAPFRIAEFDIIFGEGISYEGDIIDLGASANVITKSGTWYSFGDERLGQGKEAARIFLKGNPKLRDQIDRKIREHFAVAPTPAAAGESTAKAAAASAADKEASLKAGVTPAAGVTKDRTAGARAARK